MQPKANCLFLSNNNVIARFEWHIVYLYGIWYIYIYLVKIVFIKGLNYFDVTSLMGLILLHHISVNIS